MIEVRSSISNARGGLLVAPICSEIKSKDAFLLAGRVSTFSWQCAPHIV